MEHPNKDTSREGLCSLINASASPPVVSSHHFFSLSLSLSAHDRRKDSFLFNETFNISGDKMKKDIN